MSETTTYTCTKCNSFISSSGACLCGADITAYGEVYDSTKHTNQYLIENDVVRVGTRDALGKYHDRVMSKDEHKDMRLEAIKNSFAQAKPKAYFSKNPTIAFKEDPYDPFPGSKLDKHLQKEIATNTFSPFNPEYIVL